MRLSIRHATTYRYDTPVLYAIFQLRLTPQAAPTQMVANWDLSVPGKLSASVDAYGNALHTLVITRPTSEVRFIASGQVETSLLQDGRLLEGPGRIPLEHFTCATPLTDADEAVTALAAGARLESPADLLSLAERIGERVSWEEGDADVERAASQVLAEGQGAGRDYAHLMVACCRARGVPARVVSGYLDVDDAPQVAAHAWVDVWLEDKGWVSVDPAHRRYASGRYCRLAVGRDHPAAAPVRSMRIGGGVQGTGVDLKIAAVSATGDA